MLAELLELLGMLFADAESSKPLVTKYFGSSVATPALFRRPLPGPFVPSKCNGDTGTAFDEFTAVVGLAGPLVTGFL